MRVYLMQHGKPVPKEEDPDRPLSDKGKDEVERMSEFLSKSGVKVQEAFHSGKTRARQTAEIMLSQLNPEVKAQERPGLSPLDDVKEIASHIKDTDKDLLIAGHLPHLGKLASLLIVGDEAVPTASFQQGGVACLKKDEKGHWSVAWMVVPDIIKGSA
jgi:phosphohistidine phosphatase